MKKISLVIAVCFTLSIPVSAQFSKGTLFVGTSVGANSFQSASDNLNYSSGSNNSKGTSTSTYTMTGGPQVGVFVTDHLLLGGSVNYSLSVKNSNASTTLTNNTVVAANAKTTTSTFSTGPLMRYYFFENLSKNMFYAQLNSTVGTGSGNSSGNGNKNVNSTYESNGTVSNIVTWNAGGSVGLTHFFNDVVGMDIALGYAMNSNTSNNKSTVNTTSNTTEIVTSAPTNYKETVLTHGATFNVGFHWFLRR